MCGCGWGGVEREVKGGWGCGVWVGRGEREVKGGWGCGGVWVWVRRGGEGSEGRVGVCVCG